MYKFVGKNGQLYKFDPYEIIMKMNWKCPKGTVDDTFKCGNTPAEAKKNYNRIQKEKKTKERDKTRSKNAIKKTKTVEKKIKKINNPELKVQIDNTRSIIEKVKLEKKAGKVSKETYKELQNVISELRKSINNSKSGGSVKPKVPKKTAPESETLDKKTEKSDSTSSNTNIAIKQFVGRPDTLDLTGLSDKQLIDVTDIMKDLKDRAKQNNIPIIDTITTKRYKGMAESAGAAMGGGILYLVPNLFDSKEAFRSYSREQTFNDQMAKGLQKVIDNNGIGEDGNTYDVEYSKKVLEKLKKESEKFSSSRGYKWTPDNKNAIRPHSVNSYIDESIPDGKIVIDHEFGHHIMENDSKLYSEVRKIYFNEKYDSNGKERSNVILSASTYGDTNVDEWFAESYALHINGRDDLVHPRLRDIMKRLK